MDEHRLLATLLEETKCRDCVVAHASGSPADCAFETRLIEQGTPIYGEAEPADRVWFIKSGVVTLSGKDRDAATLAVRNNLIGVDCLVSPTRLSDAVAETEVQACTITKAALVRWLGSNKQRLRLVLDAAMNDPNVVDVIDEM